MQTGAVFREREMEGDGGRGGGARDGGETGSSAAERALRLVGVMARPWPVVTPFKHSVRLAARQHRATAEHPGLQPSVTLPLCWPGAPSVAVALRVESSPVAKAGLSRPSRFAPGNSTYAWQKEGIHLHIDDFTVGGF